MNVNMYIIPSICGNILIRKNTNILINYSIYKKQKGISSMTQQQNNTLYNTIGCYIDEQSNNNLLDKLSHALINNSKTEITTCSQLQIITAMIYQAYYMCLSRQYEGRGYKASHKSKLLSYGINQDYFTNEEYHINGNYYTTNTVLHYNTFVQMNDMKGSIATHTRDSCGTIIFQNTPLKLFAAEAICNNDIQLACDELLTKTVFSAALGFCHFGLVLSQNEMIIGIMNPFLVDSGDSSADSNNSSNDDDDDSSNNNNNNNNNDYSNTFFISDTFKLNESTADNTKIDHFLIAQQINTAVIKYTQFITSILSHTQQHCKERHYVRGMDDNICNNYLIAVDTFGLSIETVLMECQLEISADKKTKLQSFWDILSHCESFICKRTYIYESTSDSFLAFVSQQQEQQQEQQQQQGQQQEQHLQQQPSSSPSPLPQPLLPPHKTDIESVFLHSPYLCHSYKNNPTRFIYTMITMQCDFVDCFKPQYNGTLPQFNTLLETLHNNIISHGFVHRDIRFNNLARRSCGGSVCNKDSDKKDSDKPEYNNKCNNVSSVKPEDDNLAVNNNPDVWSIIDLEYVSNGFENACTSVKLNTYEMFEKFLLSVTPVVPELRDLKISFNDYFTDEGTADARLALTMLDCFCVLLCCYPYLAYSIGKEDYDLIKAAAYIIVYLMNHYKTSYTDVPKVPATLMETFTKHYKAYRDNGLKSKKFPVLNVKPKYNSSDRLWLHFFPYV